MPRLGRCHTACSSGVRSFAARALAALFLVSALAGCATQSDLEITYDRVLALEKQHEATRGQVADLNTRVAQLADQVNTATDNVDNLRGQMADLRASVDALRDDLTNVYGKLEETGHHISQKVGTIRNTETAAGRTLEQLDSRLDALTRRLDRLQGYVGLESGALTATPARPREPEESPPSPQEMPEDELYAAAKAAFDGGDLEKARQLFQTFVSRFPNSDNADNALFWIGEAHFDEKWYSKAILEYQNVIEKYPKGNKVPGALLKQGMAFAALKDTANARLIWTELIDKYPRSPEARIATTKREQLAAQ